MIRLLFFTLSLMVASYEGQSQTVDTELGVSHEYVLQRINKLREKGCKCGRKRMKPVNPVTWNNTLEISAYIHAKEMQTYNYFDHHSMSGEDVGERLDKLDYKWQYVGENLAVGQKTFDETMKDWIKSPSHCRMLMNPDMNEVAVAKYGKYWVQHFGRLMPPKTRRTKVTYTEG
ncbi:CAP domain-containing protein [Saprospiraceae bacterium]|nr:CAP domain-containing protein [Saprospiraceae bacterium]